MRRIKAFIRKFFSLSRGETNGFLILIPVMTVIIFSEPVFRSWSADRPSRASSDQKKLDVLIAQWDWEKKQTDSAETVSHHKFRFDPNKASREQLEQLGFAQRVAQRIVNYRTKGGVFRVQSDVRKIYGVDSVFYRELIPFIDLPNAYVKKEEAEHREPVRDLPKQVRFDINLADTAQLKKIYGIGNVLSLRIIAYRDRLGGFVSGDQLREVYGLDSAVVSRLQEKVFVSNDFLPRTLDVNEAAEKDFALHPYIKTKLAKAITAYRFQHGNFTSIEDLQKIAALDTETFERIKSYLVVNK